VVIYYAAIENKYRGFRDGFPVISKVLPTVMSVEKRQSKYISELSCTDWISHCIKPVLYMFDLPSRNRPSIIVMN
jgi:spore maturation protein SpmB